MQKFLRIYLPLTVIWLFFSGSTAAQALVAGRVLSSDGEPLPGVTIIEVGASNGASTDIDGRYAIRLKGTQAVLEFSFTGFETQRFTVDGRDVIDVTLQPSLNTLGEVVIVGYGVEQKALLTGSVGSIKADDIKNLPVPSIDGVMQGQTAGVQVVQNSGTPGAEMSVRIRGISSISASSQPLYVIDGIPVITGDFAQIGYEGQGVNALSDLNPNEIESITVLKDASAAAIYGARASNGVVLITTKRGKDQPSKISLNAWYGVQQAWRRLDMMDTRDWMLYRNDLAGAEVFSQEDINNIQVNTDWQDVIFRTAPTSSYEISSTGGNNRTKVFISGNFFQQDGIVIGSDYRRINGRLNIDHQLRKNLTVGASVGLSHAKTNRIEGDQSLHGPLPNGISTPAIFPVYNADGSYNQEGPYSNAVSIANEAINENFSLRSVANVFAEYRILPGLSFTTKWGVDWLNFREHAYESIKTVQGAKYNGLGFETYTQASNLVSNNTLKYLLESGKNSLELLAGYSFEQYQSRYSFIRGQDFADPNLQYINSAATIVEASAGANDQGLRSYLARASYNFDNKYLLTFSGRLDGSSKFGSNNRNGFFPAVSAGWRIGQEKFMTCDAISELKIRGGVGLTGNDDIPPFLYDALYGVTAYDNQPGVYPSNIPNPNLKWESTLQVDLGVDLGLWENRVLFTADLYRKHTRDLLLSRPLPTSSGFSQITENIGEVENKGFELSLTTDNLHNRPLKWTTRVNFSVNRNKVLKLYNGQPIDDLGRGSNRIEEGEPIGIFYSYQSLGVDPSTGDIVYADVNYDGEITTADRTKVGNPHPDFIGGVTNTLSYKGFDLNVFFQGSYGNDVFHGSRLYLESLQGGDNQLKVVNNRWQKPGDITAIPDATSNAARAASNNRVSSRFIEDGSYLRLKNLTVGYNFPIKKGAQKWISNARIFAGGQNLLTFTNYTGLDPEVNYSGNDNAVIGTDFFTFPQVRSYTFGFNLTF